MINNLELIKPLLNFEKQGDFYMLYIFKRKKDFPEMEQKNHQSVRTIKTYCVDSLDYLEERWNEIIGLCEFFGARAYIHVQSQNHHDVALDMNIDLAFRMKNKVYNQKNLFDSVVAQLKTREKRWVIDIDSKDINLLNEVEGFITYKCTPDGRKTQAIIPTLQGYHIITSKFNSLTFEGEYPEITIQKKNPTLLYYPQSLIK